MTHFQSRSSHRTHHTKQEHTIIKHVLPAPLLETSIFSGVSLKTLHVLIHRRIFRPSHLQLLGGSAVLPTSSLHPAMACVSSTDLIVASCNGSRAVECGRPSWATTALLRLSHALEHTSASKNDVPAKCIRLQALRCILHAHRDCTRRTRTFRSDILHLKQMPLSCTGPTARLSMDIVLHVAPQYSAMRPRSASHRRAVLRLTCTSRHHSSSVNDHSCRSNAWPCLPFSCGG